MVLAPNLLTAGLDGQEAAAPRGDRQVRVFAGDTIGLTAVFVGPAAGDAGAVLDALYQGAGSGGFGPTTHRVRMALENAADAVQHLVEVTAEDLPAEPLAIPGTLPRVTLELTGPLSLKVRGQITLQPTLRDVAVAAHTMLTHLFALYDRPLSVPAARLLDAADRARLVRADFRRFEQTLQAGKGYQRQRFLGVTGAATFVDVPLGLLPWLVWGGRLHVGDRRVAGAGGWRVLCE